MNRSLAYAVVAMILGVAVMLAPFLVVPTPSISFTGNTDNKPTLPQQQLPNSFAENLKTRTEQSELAAGVTPSYPTDAITVSLIFLFSLAFALGVSLFSKRMRFTPKTNVSH